MPAPDQDALLSRGYEAPQGEVEKVLAQIWADVLKVEQVGRHDNFFELGGHSLLAVNLIERMRRAELSADVRVLFSQPTLAALAAAVGSGREVAVPANLITPECTHITPDLLPLAQLDPAAIDRIVASVPGGVSNVQDIYALAPLQEGILYHHITAEQGDPYLLQSQLEFDDVERLQAFAQALQQVVDRHDILRTAVVWEDMASPAQVVWRNAELPVQGIDLDPADGDILAQLHGRFDARHYRLEVSQAPLIRLVYAEDRAHQRVVAILLFHHLALDHTALEVVSQEMQASLLGQVEPLAPAIPYRNYVAQARLGLSEQEHETFFRDMLGDIDEPTLPFGLQDVQGEGHAIREASLTLDAALSRRLRTRARLLGVSAASVFHLAWAKVLGSVSDTRSVVFGTVLMGRMQGGDGADRALGMFINTLPLRVDITGMGVQAAVKATHARLTGLLGHEHASLALVQRCSGVAQSTPLFSALLNYRHTPAAHTTLTAEMEQAWRGMRFLASEERTNYPVSLSVNDLGEDFSLDALTVASVDPQLICGYLATLLEQLVEALEQTPQMALEHLSMLSPKQTRQLTVDFNATDAEYPRDLTVVQMIEAHALHTPHAVAVVLGDQTLSYRQLNEQANQVAHHLRSLGAQADARVAICMERSPAMIVGLLGILKSGAAYVPLDPQYPSQRLALTLQDSQPLAVLVQAQTRAVLADSDIALLDLDDAFLRAQPLHNPATVAGPNHLAYVIFTSGSTGRPKGVMVEHGSLVNHITWQTRTFGFDADERILQRTSVAFDASVWEIWTPLAIGARLVLLPAHASRDVEQMAQTMVEQQVSVAQFVPSLLRLLVQLPASGVQCRYLFSGGEALEPQLAMQARALTTHGIVNLYGPTEATIDSTSWTCDGHLPVESVPIGKPIANARAYVLDAGLKPVALGVAGELYIGGAGVARGYLGRDDLTAERFLADPLTGTGRVYKTGDLVRYLSDGSLQYLGRNDDQVKLRGLRIELGEIQTCLLAHTDVCEAVVVVRDERLVAYLTLHEAASALDIEALREQVQQYLPAYMVPQAYVVLETLPLSPNGKLDRKALPEPGMESVIARGYEAPVGAVETLLAQIWADVLKVEKVGRHDHFFELGGHSLLAVGLIGRMRQAGLNADVRVLFNQPTLAALAAAVGSGREIQVPSNVIPDGCTHITPQLLPLVTLDQASIDRIVATVAGGAANVQDIYPLAPLQEGILYHHISAEQGDLYVQQGQFAFADPARLQQFAQALQQVIDRHDVLRTSFVWEGLEQPVQVVWRQAQMITRAVQFDPRGGDIAAQLAAHVDPRRHRLNVTQAPLMQLVYADDEAGRRIVATLLFHHTIMDHMAMDVVWREMEAFLLGKGDELVASVPYRNYVVQTRLASREQEHETFFRDMLGDVDEPTLPFAQQDVRDDGYDIDEVDLTLDAGLSRRLRSVTRKNGVSPASLFHLAWARVLGVVSSTERVVFGTVMMGRLQGGEGADRALGMFINTLPLRVDITDQGVQEAVKATHARLSGLLAHELASLAQVQRCSGVPQSLPLFSALFNYRHTPANAVEVSEASLRAWQGMELLQARERSNYPLTLSVNDLGEAFSLSALALASMGAQRICAYVNRVVEQLVEALEQAPQTALNSLSILPAEARQQVLGGFNDTRVDYAHGQTIHQRFERQVELYPHTLAAVYQGQSLTYSELNRQANQLAHQLIELGVQPDDRVAICAQRSLEMLVGLVAILKAGACYVPIDAAHPAERLRYLLDDSAPVAVLIQPALAQRLPTLTVPVMELDRRLWQGPSKGNPHIAGLTPAHLAYVIYTSGSTGLPKGVMVEHRTLENLVSWHCDAFELEHGSHTSSVAGFGFDAMAWEVWPALCVGATLHLPPAHDGSEDIDALLRWWLAQPLDVSFLPTPVAEYAFSQALQHPTLKTLLIGGDRLRQFNTPQRFHLVNNYGPTEATVVATSGRIEAGQVLHIGKPVANTQVYLLDERQQPVPLGVAGELYVAGAGVARGYLNRPQMSAERFLKDPFSRDPQARMYRTGDLARWLEDGTLDYLGRNDDQVKIRGVRIELGEIETRLAEQPHVREAVVLAREGRLVAYFTETQPLEVETLRNSLQACLPEYMVPAAYVRLDHLPLTANGKLDRKALPEPGLEALISRGYEAPEGEVETALAQIWADVLKLAQVGRHDNFFELGGHSLLAVGLVERMRQAGLQADVRVLFSQPTLAALAAAVGAGNEVAVPVNRIDAGCTRITPDLLPLATLDQASIDRIVAHVPGGVANVQDIYALAPLQEGLLYHHISAEQGDPYQQHALFAFDSRQRLDGFVQALQHVIDRHDILRTGLFWEQLEAPVQVVWREAPLGLDELIPRAGDVLAQLREHFSLGQHRMDIRQAPMMHLGFAHDPQHQRWIGMLSFHHMVNDATSMGVLVGEIEAHMSGRAQQLGASVPYRNYVAQARQGNDQAAHAAFFGTMLGDVDEPTLPFGVQRIDSERDATEEVDHWLGPVLSQRLRRQARHLGVSAAALYHWVWARVIGALSGRDDVVFGTVLLGRLQAGDGADRSMGMFINTLPLRVRLSDDSLSAAVKHTHVALSQLVAHEHASLTLAQRCSGVAAPAPLFSALLNYRHASSTVSEASRVAWEGIQMLANEGVNSYPLILSVDDVGEDFRVSALAPRSVGAQRVLGYVCTALVGLVDTLEHAPHAPANRTSLLAEDERRLLLQTFNGTPRDYPHQQSVHQVFEAWAQAQPQAVAAVHGQQQVSYTELNTRANRLAHHLVSLGLQAGDSVAVLLERSIDLLVCQLAISKCAAVYVPLDVNAPVERQAFMLEDSHAAWLLSNTGQARVFDVPRIDLDLLKLGDQPAHNPALEPSAETAAYIMYTSGSTGTPKGVLVPHRAITRLVINNGYADFNQHDRVAFASNPAFDASTLDVWAPLLNGGAVVVVDQDTLLSRADFAALLQQQAVSVLWMTAGLFHQYADGLLPVFTQLRYLIVGGDVLDPSVIARVLKDGAPQHLLNGYGPTEATTFSTTFEITSAEEGSIPIGRPVGNSRAYVLDAHQQPVPVGVTGELYIGGQGVALGYLNRADLTAQTFLADPFSDTGLMYRTGDLVAWRADGTLQYQGRNDQQVKIRGFRIELGEIETRLSEHPQVKDAVVLAREDEPGHKRLVAYFTERDSVDIATLRDDLLTQLPDYMVPSAYVRLDSLPLTSNGKVDRKALPAPDQDALLSRGYEAPQGEVENVLARIWADLLKVEQVGRYDNFFELGGHSLLSVSLIERMRQAGLGADVRVLFSQPTLAALAGAVGSGREVAVPANLITAACERITPDLLPLISLDQASIDHVVAQVPGGVANVQDIYVLAPLQEGILYHHITAEQGDPYLLQSQMAFDSLERLQRFAHALQAVIERHDILRTGMVWEGLSAPAQVVWRKAELPVQELILDPADGDILTQLHARFDARHYSLDVSQAPLMRLAYARDERNDRTVAVLLFHHMVLDHTALEVVSWEMAASLLGATAPLPAPVPYRNYVAQTRLGGVEQEHERFFSEMLGDIDEPTLPFGLKDVQSDGNTVAEVTQTLPVDVSRRLRTAARALGVSVASLFHLAYAQVLGAVSGRQDVVFGTVLVGRLQGGEGADRALGMFINTLPLRVDLGQHSARTGVRATHARLSALLGHEHASLSLAQRCSGVAAPAPLFSAMLNYRHSASDGVMHQTRDAWVGIETLASEERTNYPLALNVDDQGDSFRLNVQAIAVDAQRVVDYVQTALHNLVQALETAPHSALRQLSVLPAQERETVLVAFNDTARDYPLQQTLHGLFEAQVARTPNAVAVLADARHLSYCELNERANRLAHHLRELGVVPDSRVAICAERSLEMVVGLLAILKAGGGYVPLDPAYPLDRLAYMLEDSAPAVVLVQGATRALLGHLDVPVVDLERLTWQQQSASNPLIAGLTPQHQAYVIYTSGSTGKPKGVINEHSAVVNRLLWMQEAYGLDASDTVLQKTPFSFDVSVWEFFWPLFTGARLVMARPDGHKDPAYLCEIIQAERVTTLHFVPSMLEVFLAHGELSQAAGLVRVMCSGEALPGSVVRRFKQQLPTSALFNLYGPTEAAVDVTAWDCAGPTTPDNTPIGKPIANTCLYVLDEHLQPAPLGVSGELFIGGVQVARGYLNRPELTAERFVDNPFNAGRMYRTGDVGRFLADGNIEYLGRNDDQVKIRGLRIELGEIQARLGEYPQIQEAAVLAREDVPGDKRLVAYYTGVPAEAEALRTHLLALLPDYMVPQLFVHLEALPLSPNGKLDRKALPAPDLGALRTREYEAPSTDTEIALARLWAELLEVDQVGRHDHFFELGGHSLLAVSLIGRLRQEGIDANVKALFKQPTLWEYAEITERMEMVL
nr:non-ribosomal peptide synthetase [Pseudomonas salomonii]